MFLNGGAEWVVGVGMQVSNLKIWHYYVSARIKQIYCISQAGFLTVGEKIIKERGKAKTKPVVLDWILKYQYKLNGF